MDNPEQNNPQQNVEDKKYKLKCEYESINNVLDIVNEIIYKLVVGGSFEPDMVQETLSTLASHAMELTNKRCLLQIEYDELNKP